MALLLVLPLLSAAEEAPPASPGNEEAKQEDLAKAVQNPVAALISVPLQDNVDLGVEPWARASGVWARPWWG